MIVSKQVSESRQTLLFQSRSIHASEPDLWIFTLWVVINKFFDFDLWWISRLRFEKRTLKNGMEAAIWYGECEEKERKTRVVGYSTLLCLFSLPVLMHVKSDSWYGVFIGEREERILFSGFSFHVSIHSTHSHTSSNVVWPGSAPRCLPATPASPYCNPVWDSYGCQVWWLSNTAFHRDS